jgi:hypothetical protein
MNTPDQDTLVRAIVAEHVELEPNDPGRTLERLLAVLDKDEVALALDRVGRGRAIAK